MARFGDTVRPELGRTDYSGFLQGSVQGSAAIGQGIAAAGKGMGDFLKEKKLAKDDVAGSKETMNAMATLYKGTKVGDYAAQQVAFYDNDEVPFSQKHAVAKKVGPMSNMLLHFTEMGFSQEMEKARLAQGARGLNIEEENSKSRQEALRQGITEQEDYRAGQLQYFEGAGSGGGDGGAGPLPEGDGTMGMGALLPDKATIGMTPAAKMGYFEAMQKGKKEQDFATKTFKETRINPETGAEEVYDVERVMINGLPTENIVASAIHGKPYPSVDEEVNKSEKMARSKAIQTEIDDINTASIEARKTLPRVAKVIGLLADGELRTGAGAEGLASLKRLGSALGIETNVQTFEEAATVLGDEVMARVGETKGAVSEKEMVLFQQYSASTNKTTEGNLLILRAKAKSMLRSQEESRVISELQRGNATNAQIKASIEEYRDQNPVITEQQIQTIREGEARGLAPTPQEREQSGLGGTQDRLRAIEGSGQ